MLGLIVNPLSAPAMPSLRSEVLRGSWCDDSRDVPISIVLPNPSVLKKLTE